MLAVLESQPSLSQWVQLLLVRARGQPQRLGPSCTPEAAAAVTGPSPATGHTSPSATVMRAQGHGRSAVYVSACEHLPFH